MVQVQKKSAKVGVNAPLQHLEAMAAIEYPQEAD
jgi:hypothetical protein